MVPERVSCRPSVGGCLPRGGPPGLSCPRGRSPAGSRRPGPAAGGGRPRDAAGGATAVQRPQRMAEALNRAAGGLVDAGSGLPPASLVTLALAMLLAVVAGHVTRATGAWGRP